MSNPHNESLAWRATSDLLGPDVDARHVRVEDAALAAITQLEAKRRAAALRPATDWQKLTVARAAAYSARPLEPWSCRLEQVVRSAVRSWACPERTTGESDRYAPRALAALLDPTTRDRALEVARAALEPGDDWVK